MVQLHEHEATREELQCPYCHGSLAGGEEWRCPSCATPHHAECAQENGRCTVLGCVTTAPGVRRWGESRFLRSLCLGVGLLGVLAFAMKFSSLRGEPLDPFIYCVFFVGITLWGAVYDRMHAYSPPS